MDGPGALIGMPAIGRIINDFAKGVTTMSMKEKETQDAPKCREDKETHEQQAAAPPFVEEITIEELAVDGICGIY